MRTPRLDNIIALSNILSDTNNRIRDIEFEIEVLKAPLQYWDWAISNSPTEKTRERALCTALEFEGKLSELQKELKILKKKLHRYNVDFRRLSRL